MSRVRSKDTQPELFVRRLVHGMGYRFRLHAKDLPGKPDLVLRKHSCVIFVHGCFWHRHSKACPLTRLPKSRIGFWEDKLEQNRRRDAKTRRALRREGWRVLVVWECQLKSHVLPKRVFEFIEGKRLDPQE